MKNIEIKRKDNYSMILRTDEATGFASLYVVKDFDPAKPDGGQWSCSEFYGTNAYGGNISFASAEAALETGRLRDPDEPAMKLYSLTFFPNGMIFIVKADSKEDALEYTKAYQKRVLSWVYKDKESDIIDDDNNYEVTSLDFDTFAEDIVRGFRLGYLGHDERIIAFAN